jgi:3-oxoacyl-[acyl-carrier protein] reductase
VAFARAGARVVAVARRRARLDETLEMAGDGGHSAIEQDLEVPDGAQRVLERLHGLPPIDIFVHCAGKSTGAPLGTDQAVWDAAFNLMFHNPRDLAEGLFGGMAERAYGRVVFFGGTLEPGGVPNAAGAAKAALRLWAKAAANAVATDGITVNSINPGRINTEQILEVLHPDPVAREAFARNNIPAGYFGDPQDVSSLLVFLCSPLARYITGAMIPVDGGMHKWAF